MVEDMVEETREMAESQPAREAASARETMDDLLEDSGVSGLSTASREPEEDISEDIPAEHYEMMIEIERLSWELQMIKDKLTVYESEKIASDNDDTLGDLTTIVATLLPILLPYVTRKYNNKEILKKG